MIVYQDSNKNIYSSKSYSDQNLEEIEFKTEIPNDAIEIEDFVVGINGSTKLLDLDLELEERSLYLDIGAAPSKTISEALSEDQIYANQVLGLYLKHINNKETKCGGKVIKNVSGYDMGKLYLGSCNSLAIISFAYLRLKPRPQYKLQWNYSIIDKLELQTLRKLIDSNLEISLNSNNLSLSINSNELLLDYHTQKTSEEIQKILGSKLKTNINIFTKEYEDDNKKIEIHSFFSELIKIYYKIKELDHSINIKLDLRKIKIIILNPEFLNTKDYLDPKLIRLIKELQSEFSFLIKIFPISIKHKIIERALNSLNNNYESLLISQLKKTYDPDHKLNPNLLNDK